MYGALVIAANKFTILDILDRSVGVKVTIYGCEGESKKFYIKKKIYIF